MANNQMLERKRIKEHVGYPTIPYPLPPRTSHNETWKAERRDVERWAMAELEKKERERQKRLFAQVAAEKKRIDEKRREKEDKIASEKKKRAEIKRKRDEEREKKRVRSLRKKYIKDEALDGVYFAECHGFVKIGISNNSTRRIKGMQTGNPYKINLEIVVNRHLFDGQENTGLERELHLKFEESRSRGEWFFYSNEIKKYVGEMKKRFCQVWGTEFETIL